ncbi:MAG: putative sulfate exporter family transporter [Pseudomonadota bacterium]|nr:putative sulfate exporter family transporter [Pseudomonadota bacterium]
MSRVLVVLGVLVALVPGVPPAAALVAGIAIGLGPGNPWPKHTPKLVKQGLALCVVGLGFGVDLGVVARVGAEGIVVTALAIVLTLGVGIGLGRLLGVDRVLTVLIAVGTAICGGSAIAAAAPALDAKDEQVGVAIGTVFLLNAAALLVFPPVGHALGMDGPTFGRWAALAIHDTSSVVGAASAYGGGALAIATTTKLARALWIAPLTLALSWREGRGRKFVLPWFIPAFLAAAALVSLVPALIGPGHQVSTVAKQALGAVLFLTGLGVSRQGLATVGPRPLVLGVALWAFASAVGLLVIRAG